MTLLLVFGQLSFGQQFPQGEHYPFLQRTLIVSNKSNGKNYQQPEISPILTIGELATDPDFKACFLSGQVPEVVDEGIGVIQNSIRMDLDKLYETLNINLDNFSEFLRSLGNDVKKADALIFSQIDKDDSPSIRIDSKNDLESVIQAVFSESVIRRWIADAIARNG